MQFVIVVERRETRENFRKRVCDQRPYYYIILQFTADLPYLIKLYTDAVKQSVE